MVSNTLKFVLFLFTLAIVTSCSQPKKNTSVHKVDTVPKITAKSKPADTIPAYTSTIYKKYIPDSVFRLFTKYLPEWKLPDPGVWDKFWFHEYLNNGKGALVNYIPADFNGDGRTDYSVILEDANDRFGIWVLQSDGDHYTTYNLDSLDGKGSISKFEIGLELLPTGKLNYIDFEHDESTRSVELKNPAIQVVNFEKTGTAYYWQNGKYNSVTTGD